MLPGQSPSVVFFLKGARTSGTILKRAGKRIRIQHDGGTCWVDLADLAESEGSVSSSATPLASPIPSPSPARASRWRLEDDTESADGRQRGKHREAAPHLPLATPSTPPPILLTPAVQHQLKRHASGTERHVQGGAALPPLTPIDTLPTHPQLLMSLAFEAWWTNANWHSEWLELLEEAQQHHARRSLVRLHNRAAEHADRPRELIDVTARRARRAALRCVRVQLARGLRGFVAQQDRRLNAARSMRRAARYYDRVRISHAMHLLLAKRDVRRNLEDLRWRSFLGRRAALLAWRSACIDWRASCARRDILFRRAIQRMARRALHCELLELAKAYSFQGPRQPSAEMSGSALARDHFEWPTEVARSTQKWTGRSVSGADMRPAQDCGAPIWRQVQAHVTNETTFRNATPQVRRAMITWRDRTGSMRAERIQAQALLRAKVLLRAHRRWRRHAHRSATSMIARYVSFRRSGAAVIARLKHDLELARPRHAARWRSDSIGPELWLPLARAFARLQDVTTDGMHTAYCHGRAYSHWQFAAALQALHRLHRFTQKQLDIRIQRLLEAQSGGSFDVRLLPSSRVASPVDLYDTTQHDVSNVVPGKLEMHFYEGVQQSSVSSRASSPTDQEVADGYRSWALASISTATGGVTEQQEVSYY